MPDTLNGLQIPVDEPGPKQNGVREAHQEKESEAVQSVTEVRVK